MIAKKRKNLAIFLVVCFMVSIFCGVTSGAVDLGLWLKVNNTYTIGSTAGSYQLGGTAGVYTIGNTASAYSVAASSNNTYTLAGAYSVGTTMNVYKIESTMDTLGLKPGSTVLDNTYGLSSTFVSKYLTNAYKVANTATGKNFAASISVTKTSTIIVVKYDDKGKAIGYYVMEIPYTNTNSGGNPPSGGDSGSSGNTGTVVPSTPTSSTGTATAVMVADGDKVVGTVTEQAIDTGLSQAGTGTLIIDATGADGTSVKLTIPSTAFTKINGSTASTVTIKTSVGDISFPKAAIAAIAAAGTGDVSLTVTKTADDTFELSLTVGDTAVTSFSGALVGVTLKYTATDTDLSNYVVVYVGTDGNVVRPLSVVSASGASFKTPSFSTYKVVKQEAVAFTDVAGNWSADNINFTSVRGIFEGRGAKTFVPAGNITRAEFVTIIARLVGADVSKTAESTFTDVKSGDWFAKYVMWASENGITDGVGDSKFAPNTQISRQDLCVMIQRAAEKFALAIGTTGSAADFADKDGIASYATEAIDALVKGGIIAGKDNNNFDPKASAKRDEAAKIVALLIQGQF